MSMYYKFYNKIAILSHILFASSLKKDLFQPSNTTCYILHGPELDTKHLVFECPYLLRCLGKFLTCYCQLNTMYNYRNSNKTPFFCKKINKTLLGLSAGQIGNSQVATLQRLAVREF